MGDRANVFVMEEAPSKGVYLYTHWDGDSLPSIVQAALQRAKDRWNDSPYLARVIFCEMVQKDVIGTTGYGISARIGDNSHPVIVIDMGTGSVGFAREPQDVHDPQPYPEQLLTFENFVNANAAELKAFGWR